MVKKFLQTNIKDGNASAEGFPISNGMNILIITGIYPPEIGGPAEYAKNLKDVWATRGHSVSVKIFGQFRKWPWGLRHIIFFFYILPSVRNADYIVALDAFSAGVVTVASKLFSKTIIFRTGGDVVWELYTERTGEMVLLRDFYKTCLGKLSAKEKIIFSLMKWTLRNISAIVWSTEWQKNIFMEPYVLRKQKHFIIENYYGPRLEPVQPTGKNFIGATRRLKWKNIKSLQETFDSKEAMSAGAVLDTDSVPHDKFLEKISRSYAVIVASLGDISPNTILDAIRCQKPFIVTRETGLSERIREVALFVEPKNQSDILEKVLWLCNKDNYESQVQKLRAFNFVHSWEDMADEYIALYNQLK